MKKLLSFFVVLALLNDSPCLAKNKSRAVIISPITATSQWVEVKQGGSTNNLPILTKDMPDRKWWLEFKDPYLSEYVQTALIKSPTIKVALIKIDQGRAQVRQQVSNQLPSMNASGIANRIHLPAQLVQNNFIERDFNAYALFGSVQYELDLWGKYWNTTQSARQELKALQNDEKAVEVVLAADVSNAYFNMIRAEQLELYNQQYLKGLQELLALTNVNYQIGLEPYETVLRLQRDIAETEKKLSTSQEQKGLYAHQLSTLISMEPRTINQLPHKQLEQIELPIQIQMSLPLLVIHQRPDLLAQEARLKEFSIDVRVAKKNFLPTMKISDYLGLSAQRFKNLFDGDAFFNILIGSVSQSVFEGGKKLADLRLKQSVQREQIENYRQSILVALREVEDSLAALKRSYEDQEKNRKEVQSSLDSMTITSTLYQIGLDSKLSVLKAKNEFLNYKAVEISDRANTATSIVNLYKALGGGF